MEANDTKPSLRILHLEDNESDRIFLEEMLITERFPSNIEAVKSRDDFEIALRNKAYDLIISDYSLPSFNGMAALSIARRVCPNTPFIFFSGTIGEEMAIEGLQGGAVDYVLKQRPSRLLPAIRRALNDAKERARLRDAEVTIREQAELLNKASDAIILCNLERQVLFWNRGAEDVYGWTASEAIGKNLADLLFHGNPPPEIETAIKSLNQSGEWAGELQEFTKDNRTITVQGRATLIRDDQGQPKSLLLINTDITERKQLEEQFLRAQRLESLGTLISGIAHDLNNALSPVLMGINILRAHPNPKEAGAIFDMVEASTRRGADMVKQVLAFARGADTRKTTIQVDRLVKEMGKIIADIFPKNIKCKVHTSQEIWPVSGYATQLHQVLMNLCVNARDAMPNGGTMVLSTKNVRLEASDVAGHPEATPGNYICVTVEDSGTGINDEHLKKIFEPFFTTKAPGKGTGLGLPTSRNIILNHGGFMTVKSEPGKGTQFTFFLPAAGALAGEETTSPILPLPGGSGECVLVVDDEEAVLAITKSTLENFGYTVLVASSGPEAVACFADQREKIKLVLTDMAMPFMDGVATTLALRKIKSDVPIIVTSGLDQRKDEDTSRRIKAAAFLQKPFTAETLLRQVHTVLSGKRESDGPATKENS
jgi:two-component system cell cycle sensor histidine kinase/response regulator CckA